MKRCDRAASLFILYLCAALPSACGHAKQAPPTTANPPAASASTVPQARRAWVGRVADPTVALLQATHELWLTNAQSATVRSLEEDLQTSEKGMRAAFRALHTDLAAQVRAGAIDNAKVQADESVAANALQAHMAKETETLNRLHAALEPAQRKSAVAVVQATRGRTAVQPRESAPAKPEEEATKRHLDRLTSELGLDASQRQQVAALLSAPPAERRKEERPRRMDTLLKAFESGTFDAKTALPAPPSPPGDMLRQATEREAAFLTKLLPILRPEQREKLAASIEKREMGPEHDDGE